MSLPSVAESHAGATVRRSRPRDRKDQILAAASDLFYRFGYHNVSTEQIAAVVGITAGALYRHFRSKQDLLASAVVDRFDRATSFATGDLDGPQDLDRFVSRIVESAVGRRELGVLWSRETRHLGPEHRATVRARFSAFLEYFAGELRRLRPELPASASEFIAWSTLAVLTSPSYHHTPASEERIRALLQPLARSVCLFEPGPETTPDHVPAEGSSSPFMSRRESLLVAASRLFNVRGYQTVTMDDVGAAVGVTSTSVYRYFPTKSDLLAAVISRAEEPLRLGAATAIASAATPKQALSRLVSAYIGFALDHHDLLGVLVAEVTNLPTGVRLGVTGAQHDYVAEWVRLASLAHPEMDVVEVRFRVHAALTVVNDVTRTTHLRERSGIADELLRVAVLLVTT